MLQYTFSAEDGVVYYCTVQAVDSAGNAGEWSESSNGAFVDLPPRTTATPSSGTYFPRVSVTLTASKPSTIYYTTDGSEPNQNSPVYTQPILIESTTTLRFYALGQNGKTETPKKVEQYTIPAPTGTIADVRRLPDGTFVRLRDCALYLKSGQFGYIEEIKRFAGIRLEGNFSATKGELVSVSGTVHTSTGGERYIACESVVTEGTVGVRPLGASNASVKSGMMDGIFVTAWGRVRIGSITANSFVIDDGSDPNGLLVRTTGIPNVTGGQFVVVTGAVGVSGERFLFAD